MLVHLFPPRPMSAHPGRLRAPAFLLTGAVLVGLLGEFVPCHAAALMYRPAKKHRTVTAGSYQVQVQKNGRLDVVLSSEMPIVENAFPMVWFDGEEEPEPLPIDGRWSQRRLVRDPLGEGPGMEFSKRTCLWIIRTYPTKPFLVVQVAFINRSRKSVRIKALMPWCVGAPASGRISLGPGTLTSAILDNGRTWAAPCELPNLTQSPCTSLWSMAIHNRTADRCLIAGFLTNDKTYGQVQIAGSAEEEDDCFGLFRAISVFDPPVEIPPEGRLDSEVFYISVAEGDPLSGLERYGHAVAAVNQVPIRRKPFRPHGPVLQGESLTEQEVLEEMAFLDENLRPYGWSHISIGPGWNAPDGRWEPDPGRFPRGMKALVDDLHGHGMTAGLWLDPLRISSGGQAAQEHPEWVARNDGETALIDIAAPGADKYVTQLISTVTREWGFDEVRLGTSTLAPRMPEGISEEVPGSAVERMRHALGALQEGLGPNRFLAVSGPVPLAGLFAQSVGNGAAPITSWDQAEKPGIWSCTDAMTYFSRQYYYAPYLCMLDSPGTPLCREGEGLSASQAKVFLTASALTGGPIRLAGSLREATPEQLGFLRTLVPTHILPARPLRLFEEGPQVYHLPFHPRLGDDTGKWDLVAVFNLDESEDVVVDLPLTELGLSPTLPYTVFESASENYHGIAKERLQVQAPPTSVRIFGLRNYEPRPMFLATNAHIAQGAIDMYDLAWAASSGRLSGRFDGIADAEYVLHILVPDSFDPIDCGASSGLAKGYADERTYRLHISCTESEEVRWYISFSRGTSPR